MARLVVADAAREDLRDLIATHELPASTAERVAAVMAPLASFPRIGVPLEAGLARLRFLVGPWRWMIIVYEHDESRDEVAVVRIVDGRTSSSPTVDR